MSEKARKCYKQIIVTIIYIYLLQSSAILNIEEGGGCQCSYRNILGQRITTFKVGSHGDNHIVIPLRHTNIQTIKRLTKYEYF